MFFFQAFVCMDVSVHQGAAVVTRTGEERASKIMPRKLAQYLAFQSGVLSEKNSNATGEINFFFLMEAFFFFSRFTDTQLGDLSRAGGLQDLLDADISCCCGRLLTLVAGRTTFVISHSRSWGAIVTLLDEGTAGVVSGHLL